MPVKPLDDLGASPETLMRDELKVVSVLFADVVGSTALGERLDPEEVRLVVGEAVARMVVAVEEFGGMVKDLAGDGILALFGAPVAHEDDAERAVRAGLRIAHGMREYGVEVERGWGVAGFAVRVGVTTGPVVLGSVGGGSKVEYGAMGDAVNTAARLQAAASPGAVLVEASTRRFVEPLFEWGPPQELSLKGKAEAVYAHEVWAALQASERSGRPLEETPLVGRDRELAVAGEAIDEVRAGAGGILFVRGEPGVGKSRLVAELRRSFHRAPSDGGAATWLEGRCTSYGESHPYGPFQDLLRAWLEVSPDQPEVRARVALKRRLEPLFPDLAGATCEVLGALLGLSSDADASTRPSAVSPEVLQRRTFETVMALLERLAADGPVVVALDDFQWADPTSVQLAGRLLDLPDRAAVLLVLAQRTERDHGSWELRERAFREVPHRTREVHLGPLPEDADGELLAALVGSRALPEDTRRRVLAAAGGNPFFLEELVRSMQDTGVLVQEQDGWRLDRDIPVEIPHSVQRVILARIDRLPASCRDVLSAASVLGTPFALPLLDAVAGSTGLHEALRELQRLDLVRESRRWPHAEYRFKHPLIQETAYRSLVRSNREQLHRAAAEAIERLFADRLEEHFAILAHHHLMAGDEERAFDCLRKAAEAAERVHAVEEALEHWSGALGVASRLGLGAEVVCELQLRRGLVEYQSGRFPDARSDLENAVELAVQAELQALRLRALEALGTLRIQWGGRIQDGVLYLEDALRIAEDIGDEAAEVSVLNRLTLVSANQLQFDEALRYSGRARELAERLGDERALARALDGAKMVAAYLGDFDTLRSILPRLQGILRRHDDLWYLQWSVFEASFVPLAGGRWDEARALVEEALAIDRRIGDRATEPFFLATLGWVERCRGNYGSALEAGRTAAAMAREMDTWGTGWSEALLGTTLLELLAVDEAAQRLEYGLESAQAVGARHYVLRCAGPLAWALALGGDLPRARELAERAERLLSEVSTPSGAAFLHGGPIYLAVAEAWLALGEGDRAQEVLRAVLTAAERSGWFETMAHGSLLRGRARLRAGDRPEAEPFLRRALEVAERSGLRGIEWRAHAALAGVVPEEGHAARAREMVEELAAGIDEDQIRRGFLEGAHRSIRTDGAGDEPLATLR